MACALVPAQGLRCQPAGCQQSPIPPPTCPAQAVLVPLSTNKSEAAAAPPPAKAAREVEPAEGAEAKKARL